MDIIQSNNDNLLQAQESAAPYAVNVSAGSVNGTVSNQWMNRPADETFDSLDSLKAFCNGRASVSSDAILNTRMGRGWVSSGFACRYCRGCVAVGPPIQSPERSS